MISMCSRLNNFAIWLIGFMPRLTDSRCLALQKTTKKTSCVLFHPKFLLTVSRNVRWKQLTALLLLPYFPWKLATVFFSFNLGRGTALIECTLETKPLELNADYAVSLKVEPIEAIYDSVSYSWNYVRHLLFLNFCFFCSFVSLLKYQTRLG